MFVDEKLKEERRKICNNCEFKRKKFTLFWLRINRIKQCSICKCSIDAKTLFSNSECPKKKW